MSVRISLIQCTLVALPFFAAAQTKQFITSARSGDAVRQSKSTHENLEEAIQSVESTNAGGSIDTGESVNTLPLFGERPKTAAQIDEEIHFLNDCDRNFATRSDASSFFAARGWDYIGSGQLDTAAHRFNLSWLLNDRNADAYWGLGVVCYQKNRLPDAIRMMKKGIAVDDSNTVLMTDLATVELKQYQEKPDEDMLTEAEGHLQKAVSLNPNALSYQKISMVYYLKANYEKAWDYFHQARNIDFSSLDLGYLNELLAKAPDPKGVFK
ncbi:tetratricopeptide repeat protein [Spirosoma sp. HMF4905]|uniref:Tetratricopeptide repeat protein n=1 Tax=Spirosoma arboris TaxID=2682092 RepID=A0A7K1SHU0_9BACT|nr:tetratricopeptide repeat protein [Spirosoma arboris]MVM33335.1 tetratricopeptide repeat protein [Spirosoma arboris]